MSKRRPRAPRPEPAPPRAPVNADDPWSVSAWHAQVWACLLEEIPKLVEERRRAEALQGRLTTFRLDFPGDPEIRRMERELETARKLRCELTPRASTRDLGCTIATIEIEESWPNPRSVEFAMSDAGELCIRCTGIPERETRLPSVLRLPDAAATPRSEAQGLVRRALALVTLP